MRKITYLLERAEWERRVLLLLLWITLVGARAVQAPASHEWPVLTCASFTYWRDVPVGGAGLYSRPERMIVALWCFLMLFGESSHRHQLRLSSGSSVNKVVMRFRMIEEQRCFV
jgi:hypothetical protein